MNDAALNNKAYGRATWLSISQDFLNYLNSEPTQKADHAQIARRVKSHLLMPYHLAPETNGNEFTDIKYLDKSIQKHIDDLAEQTAKEAASILKSPRNKNWDNKDIEARFKLFQKIANKVCKKFDLTPVKFEYCVSGHRMEGGDLAALQGDIISFTPQLEDDSLNLALHKLFHELGHRYHEARNDNLTEEFFHLSTQPKFGEISIDSDKVKSFITKSSISNPLDIFFLVCRADGIARSLDEEGEEFYRNNIFEVFAEGFGKLSTEKTLEMLSQQNKDISR